MKVILLLWFLLSVGVAHAKVSVMFHPYEPTLGYISKMVEQAEESLDIAMYSMDSSLNSPVIQSILSEKIQARIKSGDLKIRLIFEGYKGSRQKLYKEFESMGIDVKYLAGKSMHHKFAIIDSAGANPKLITGSANWSKSSRNNYNENILFVENQKRFIQEYVQQFEFLWLQSTEYGFAKEYKYPYFVFDEFAPGVGVLFNTENFTFSENGKIQNRPQGYVLTKRVVESIDKAENEILIASTRIKLRPIYEAIKRAAQRGVKIKIIVSMAEYEYISTREKAYLPECSDFYLKKCSAGKNFTMFLTDFDYEGKQNVELRVKYFHISKFSHLSKQMHSKYLIIDNNLLTGSFNFSYSSEWNHIENLNSFSGERFPDLVERFRGDFDYMWDMNRDRYHSTVKFFESAAKEKRKVSCSFEPMVLSYGEIDYLLNSGQRHNTALSHLCQ